MSNNYSYLEVEPEAIQSQYEEFDNVDFKLNFVNSAMLPNSIRIMADVKLYNGGNVVNNASNKIYYDCLTGAHSFIDSIITTTQNQGTLESLNNYGRLVKMINTGTLNRDDVFNSGLVCEMIMPYDNMTNGLLQGYKLENDNTPSQPMDFFIKPNMCLNNVSVPISYNKTGEITISIRLARINNALFGGDMTSSYEYRLENLKLAYAVVPDTQEYGSSQVEMLIKSSLVQTLNSPTSVLNIKSPIVADSVFMSFINVLDDNQLIQNSLTLQPLPQVSRVEWVFNDNTNGLISYDIDNYPELRHYTEQSFKSLSNNDFTLAKVENNKGYCVGFEFGYTQLINSKITIILNSALNYEVNAYIYLNGVLTI